MGILPLNIRGSRLLSLNGAALWNVLCLAGGTGIPQYALEQQRSGLDIEVRRSLSGEALTGPK